MNERENKKFTETFKEWYPLVEKLVFVFMGSVALIVTIRLAPVFKSIDTLTNKVSAVENRTTNIEEFIIEHKVQSQSTNIQLAENGMLLKLMTDYFKLTPR